MVYGCLLSFVLISDSSANPDYASFHLGFHCLSKYLFRDFLYTNAESYKKIKSDHLCHFDYYCLLAFRSIDNQDMKGEGKFLIVGPCQVQVINPITVGNIDFLFNTTSRYLDDKLIKANTSDTKASFLVLHLTISNDSVSTKLYYKFDNFDLKLPIPIFVDDVPRFTSYRVYISQLI